MTIAAAVRGGRTDANLNLQEMKRKDERWLLISLMSVPIMVLLNAGLISIALPSIRAELHASVADVAWIVVAYSVPLVVVTPLGNTLGDLVGKRHALLLGLLLFAVASGTCALSTNFDWLLVGRVLQGVGIAGLNPICMSIIVELFPPDRRGRAIAFWQSAGPVAFGIAPILGGLVVEFSGWRVIFYLLLAASLAAIGFVTRYTPHFAPRQTFRETDWKGIITLSVGIAAPMLALAHINSQARTAQVLALLLVGFAGLIAFAWIESKQACPLVDLGLFRNRAFSFAAAAGGLRSGSLASTSFLLSLFLQEVGGYTPTQAGFLFISRSMVSFFAIPLGGCLADRLRPNLPGAAGMGLMAISLALLSLLGPEITSWQVVVYLALLGLGMGVALPSIVKSVVGSVPPEQIGMAAGLERMGHSAGVVTGPALVGLLLAARIAYHSVSNPAPMGPTQAYNEMFCTLAAASSIGGLLLASSRRLPATLFRRGKEGSP